MRGGKARTFCRNHVIDPSQPTRSASTVAGMSASVVQQTPQVTMNRYRRNLPSRKNDGELHGLHVRRCWLPVGHAHPCQTACACLGLHRFPSVGTSNVALPGTNHEVTEQPPQAEQEGPQVNTQRCSRATHTRFRLRSCCPSQGRP